MGHILEMKGITKWFGSLEANSAVDLSLSPGEILAVVGENGAGKTTLMKILYGLEKPDSGSIVLKGSAYAPHNPREAIRQGIGMVQQHFMLFPDFTVAENIVFGLEPRRAGIVFDREKATERVRELCDRYALRIDPAALLRNCPVGLQQRVEILKILNQNADIIILDEPSAVLTPQEVDELMKTIRRLASMGKSFIIITHKLREVMEVSDRVIVLRQGKVVGRLETKDTTTAELSYLMVGRTLAEPVIGERPVAGDVLRVEHLALRDSRGHQVLKGVSLHVGSGEIVGIAGVSGNGQSELVECITGLSEPESGTVILNGKDITGKRSGEVRASGCAHIPEDRYAYGCAAGATLAETMLMGRQRTPEYSGLGTLKIGAIRKFARNVLDKYGVKYGAVGQKASELSGGNLQKLIVAREIELNTPFMVAAEPTRGVDVGAMEFIHEKLREKRESGGSILLISSELSEILALSDRIYTMYGGTLNAEFPRREADEEKLGFYMMGCNTAPQCIDGEAAYA